MLAESNVITSFDNRRLDRLINEKGASNKLTDVDYVLCRLYLQGFPVREILDNLYPGDDDGSDDDDADDDSEEEDFTVRHLASALKELPVNVKHAVAHLIFLVENDGELEEDDDPEEDRDVDD